MIKLILFVALILFSLSGQAQKQVSIENEIRQLEQMTVKARLAEDTISFKQLLAPEFIMATPRGYIISDRASFFQEMRDGIDYIQFERTIEQILLQKNLAITMGFDVFVSDKDIPEAKAGDPVKRRFTNVWAFKKGKWQMIARHAAFICQ